MLSRGHSAATTSVRMIYANTHTHTNSPKHARVDGFCVRPVHSVCLLRSVRLVIAITGCVPSALPDRLAHAPQSLVTANIRLRRIHAKHIIVNMKIRTFKRLHTCGVRVLFLHPANEIFNGRMFRNIAAFRARINYALSVLAGQKTAQISSS